MLNGGVCDGSPCPSCRFRIHGLGAFNGPSPHRREPAPLRSYCLVPREASDERGKRGASVDFRLANPKIIQPFVDSTALHENRLLSGRQGTPRVFGKDQHEPVCAQALVPNWLGIPVIFGGTTPEPPHPIPAAVPVQIPPDCIRWDKLCPPSELCSPFLPGFVVKRCVDMPTPEALLKPFLAEDDRNPRTLRAKVVTHVGSIRAAAQTNELLPVDLAEVIAKRLTGLLDDLEKLPAEQQQLVLGAARYFISDSDHRPDTKDAMGLDDDLMVLNFVVTTIGRTDLIVEDE